MLTLYDEKFNNWLWVKEPDVLFLTSSLKYLLRLFSFIDFYSSFFAFSLVITAFAEVRSRSYYFRYWECIISCWRLWNVGR